MKNHYILLPQSASHTAEHNISITVVSNAVRPTETKLSHSHASERCYFWIIRSVCCTFQVLRALSTFIRRSCFAWPTVMQITTLRVGEFRHQQHIVAFIFFYHSLRLTLRSSEISITVVSNAVRPTVTKLSHSHASERCHLCTIRVFLSDFIL